MAGECVSRNPDAGTDADGAGEAEADRVEVAPAQAELGVGLTMTLEAEALDAQGQPMPSALFEWETSDANTVSVDDRGVIRGVSLGTATITARSITNSDVWGISQIKVVEGDIQSVIIEPDPIHVLPGQTASASATARNAAFEPVEAAQVVWAVEDKAIATVDAEGVVEGIAEGQTRLIANVEGVEGSAVIDVRPIPVDRVEISPAAPTTVVGQTVQLEATGFDSEGAQLSGREATWTSQNEAVATVDTEGLVRGVSAGTAAIKVEMGVVSSKVTVTVLEPNAPPVARDHTASTAEDAPIDLSLGASDDDGDTLSFSIETQPTHGALSSFDAATGQVTYTPEADYVGTDSFTFSATDGEDASAPATVTIRIGGVNDAPVARDDSATAQEDTAVTVDVVANDGDPDGDSLTVSVATQPSNGSATVENNAIVYTPKADFHGTDSLTYEISDGSAGAVGARLSIEVTPINDAPVANDDVAETDEEQPVSIDVVSNDVDIDGDSLTVSSTTTSAQGVNVTIEANGTLSYTPPAGFTGSDTFDYRVSDGSVSANATVTVDVNAVNHAPVAADDTVTVTLETTTTIDVLTNDSDVDSEDSLSISGADTSSTSGSISVNTDGTIDYTAPSSTGTDTFGYTVSDGRGGSDSATVTITVQ